MRARPRRQHRPAAVRPPRGRRRATAATGCTVPTSWLADCRQASATPGRVRRPVPGEVDTSLAGRPARWWAPYRRWPGGPRAAQRSARRPTPRPRCRPGAGPAPARRRRGAPPPAGRRERHLVGSARRARRRRTPGPRPAAAARAARPVQTRRVGPPLGRRDRARRLARRVQRQPGRGVEIPLRRHRSASAEGPGRVVARLGHDTTIWLPRPSSERRAALVSPRTTSAVPTSRVRPGSRAGEPRQASIRGSGTTTASAPQLGAAGVLAAASLVLLAGLLRPTPARRLGMPVAGHPAGRGSSCRCGRAPGSRPWSSASSSGA